MKNLPRIVIAILLVCAAFYGCVWLFNHSGMPWLAIIVAILLGAVLLSKKGIAYFKSLF